MTRPLPLLFLTLVPLLGREHRATHSPLSLVNPRQWGTRRRGIDTRVRPKSAYDDVCGCRTAREKVASLYMPLSARMELQPEEARRRGGWQARKSRLSTAALTGEQHPHRYELDSGDVPVCFFHCTLMCDGVEATNCMQHAFASKSSRASLARV